MSNQAEHEHQPSKTLTPEEQRQSILSQLDATKEAVRELSDEEVEQVAGGGGGRITFGHREIIDRLKTIMKPGQPEHLPGQPGPGKRIPGHEPPPGRP